MPFLTLYALASHFAGDFPLQTDWMAANKLDSARVRFVHCAVYTTAYAPLLAHVGWELPRVALFVGLLFSTHFAIDSKRWNEAVPIWYDQALHVIALAAVVAITEGVF